MKTLNLQAIIIDKGTQSRAQISEETVTDYAEAMSAGDTFPPITVYHDGVDYYLADGFHRLHAAQRLGRASIQAEVKTGTLRDAILFSLGANRDHGLRRTNADKRKCVQTLLEDFEWGELSVNEMARICGVSPQLVSAVKAEMDGGTKVSSVNFNAPKKEKKPVKLDTVIEAPVEPQMDEAVQELLAENQRLADKLAVNALPTEEEKQAATDTISELREQIRILEIENQSLKISRDTYQRENSELKKTVSSLQRKLKKEE
tara:strand:+ start:1468 stop:2247 length:780 start_codon:yes stop_codon:yes gene_type:complete